MAANDVNLQTRSVERDNPSAVQTGLLRREADQVALQSLLRRVTDLLRVIPPAILTGQVTGLVAAMALDDGCDVADVNIRELQRRLELANVPIHFDDALIPADRTVEHDDTYVHI